MERIMESDQLEFKVENHLMLSDKLHWKRICHEETFVV